jgi:energy-coupling factor transporter ATP-binding protein EcfA2
MYAHETLGDHEEVRATVDNIINTESLRAKTFMVDPAFAVSSTRHLSLDSISEARDRLNDFDSEEAATAAVECGATGLGAVASLCPQAGPRAIIGVTGHKGSGKDTFAKVVTQVLGEDKVAVVKFADCLKDMLRTMFRYAGADAATIEECVEGDLKEVPAPPLNGATPRRAMVTLGTEWGRELIDENIWADLTKRHIQSNPDLAGKVVLVTDVRFPNEAEVIAELGGSLIRVNRPDLCPDRTHASERSIDALKAQEVFTNTNKEAFLREAAGWTWHRFLQK